VWKWAGITFGVGMVLLILDVYMSSKKKGGIQHGDKVRLVGVFWVALFVAGLVAVVVWLFQTA
jgi:hypothetical protein